MSICILIPAYNESNAIAKVIKGCRQYGLDVIVVDDGSSDNTARIAEQEGAIVVRSKVNKGKGYAIKEGIAFILKGIYDGALIIDADGQHDPFDIPKFLNCFKADNADMVIGNRMQDYKKMPLVRRLTNRFMSFLISKITGQDIPDTQCGFRLISRRVLESYSLKSEHFEIESEMIFEAARKKYNIKNVIINTIYRDEKSYINPFRDTIRFAKLLLRYKSHGR